MPAPEDGRPGEGQRLTPDAPHNGGRPAPPRGQPPQSPRQAAPTEHSNQGDNAGPPRLHTRVHSTRVAEGERLTQGTPRNGERRPPRGTLPQVPARAHAVRQGQGPHAHTNRTRDTRVAEPRPPAPGEGRPGEGQHLTPDAPHNDGRPPHRGRPSTTPTARSPRRTCKPRGQCWDPTPAHPRPQHVDSGPRQPARRAGSRGRGSARPQTRLTKKEGTPPGDAPPPPPQRATPADKGARCGAAPGSPRPRQPHPGHTGRGIPAARPRG